MLAWRKMAHYRRTGRSIAHSDEPRDPASSAQSRLSLRDLIRIQDFMAVLMVIATAFTGYATWRYVEVSRDIFGAAERPYVGVQGIRIDQSASRQPHLIVEYRDFGNIPADQTIIIGQLTINGQLVPGQSKAQLGSNSIIEMRTIATTVIGWHLNITQTSTTSRPLVVPTAAPHRSHRNLLDDQTDK
jgi:hypothetical protein